MVSLDESVVSLAEVTKLLPRRRQGKRPNVATLYRWTRVGVRGVVLESIQCGGTRCTSREALDRFFAALTAQAAGNPVPRGPRSPRAEVQAAERVLDAAGI
jgi:hypothetical protein